MNFTTLEFAIFVPIVFLIYWFPLKNTIKGQNILLLIASYIFYGWWDWRFLVLIAFSSTLDYLVGILLDKTEEQGKRKFYLGLSLLGNLGILGFFKYYNFFIDNLDTAFSFFGYSISSAHLDIILPIGISFYTLQTLSYTIDVYRGQTKATYDFVAFYAYVSFFPQLVAGPIERSTRFLPQFLKKRTFNFDEARDGGRQFLWGLFKKLVIANNIGVFNALELAQDGNPSGIKLFLLVGFSSIQTYCDFSAYSDMAIGTARFFGFNLMKNFDFPFFSKNIADFWGRWHISLIVWIREYGVKSLKTRTPLQKFTAINIIFFLTGLWHGADWNFIVWGLINAIYLIIYSLTKKKRRKRDDRKKLIPSFYELFQMLSVFSLFTFSSIYFYSAYYNLGDVWETTQTIFSTQFFTGFVRPTNFVIAAILIMFFVEWLQRSQEHGLANLERWIPKPIRWIGYYFLVGIIAYYGDSNIDFIYFQF